MVVRYQVYIGPPRAKAAARPKPTPASGFLFAVVGVQPNGLALTVNSMLAQQDLDPWDEAAYLAGCATREALTRLESRIRAAPLVPFAPGEITKVASNLLRLLYAAQSEPEQAPARREQNTMTKQPKPRRGDMLRITIVVIAAATLLVIGLIDPKSILSGSGGNPPAVSSSTEQPAPALKP